MKKSNLFVFFTQILFLIFLFFPYFARAFEVFTEISNEDLMIFEPLGNLFLDSGGEKHDGDLTHGLSLSFAWKNEKPLKALLQVTLQQTSFTPRHSHKHSPMAVKGDRPFAGWLGASFGSYFLFPLFSTQKKSLFKMKHISHPMIEIGVLGPASKASEFQNIFHNLTNKKAYSGWQDQVKNQKSLSMRYDHSLHFNFSLNSKKETSLEGVFHGTGVVGPVLDYFSLGAHVVLGSALLQSYGPPRFSVTSDTRIPLETEHKYSGFSWNVFFGVERRFMGKNEFLEGKTNHSLQTTVTRIKEVNDFQMGFKCRFRKFLFRFTFSKRSKEFTHHKGSALMRIGIGAVF